MKLQERVTNALYHYYDAKVGPFKNISDLSVVDAKQVVEHSPWLETWYENSSFIRIPIEEFDISTLSFTYGDSHPTFSPRVNYGKEYRKQLYAYNEILKIIEKYGLPQEWNNDGKYGPERYIEVHVWSDETIKKYMI